MFLGYNCEWIQNARCRDPLRVPSVDELTQAMITPVSEDLMKIIQAYACPLGSRAISFCNSTPDILINTLNSEFVYSQTGIGRIHRGLWDVDKATLSTLIASDVNALNIPFTRFCQSFVAGRFTFKSEGHGAHYDHDHDRRMAGDQEIRDPGQDLMRVIEHGKAHGTLAKFDAENKHLWVIKDEQDKFWGCLDDRHLVLFAAHFPPYGSKDPLTEQYPKLSDISCTIGTPVAILWNMINTKRFGNKHVSFEGISKFLTQYASGQIVDSWNNMLPLSFAFDLKFLFTKLMNSQI